MGEPRDALGDALAAGRRAPRDDCKAIGITNQRETTVLWDRATGKPVHHAIVWQDRRTAARCRELHAAGLDRSRCATHTGLVIDPYFSGTKLAWMLRRGRRRAPSARSRASSPSAPSIAGWSGTLTGGAVHVTDATNASRTLLYDIRDRRLGRGTAAKLLHVPAGDAARGPRVLLEVYAHTDGVPASPDGIPIAGIAGDQQAALFGQTCFEVGDAEVHLRHGRLPPDEHGRRAGHLATTASLTTIAWRIEGKTVYALEGSSFIAGAAVQWLRDGLGIIRSAADVEALAAKVDSAGDVVFVPALAGLGAPYWDPDARGLIHGLTRDTTAAHIARATLEGIAFQITDLAEAMEKDAGRPIRRLRVDGGAARNDLMMQFQSDLLHVPVDRPQSVETTALGAAYLAGLAVGIFPDLDAVVRAHHIEKTFHPVMDEHERAAHLERWRRAVARARSELGTS